MMMRLQMIQKPPVVFTQYDPARAISPADLALALNGALRRSDAVSRLWLSYGRTVLADVDPCMEANEGAAATLALASRYRSLSRMEVSRIPEGGYALKRGEACLCLTETAAGEVFLSCSRREACGIDLTDFGSDAAAYFIATMFAAYERVAKFYDTIRKNG